MKITKFEARDYIKRNNNKGYFNSEERRQASSKPRIYIWPDDWKVMDDFITRAEGIKNNDVYKTARKDGTLDEILKRAGLEGGKVGFSRAAGCSCGCSPGFIVNGVRKGMDVFVNVQPE